MSFLISESYFNKSPFGNLPSVECILYYAISKEAILAFDSILLNRAIVITLALIFAIFSFCYTFYSSSNFDFNSDHSISLDYLAIFIFFTGTTSFFFSRWSIISPILSARKGSDHENKSRPFGRLNGYSTSLYCLMFILSFSIKITAPLFLYEPQ